MKATESRARSTTGKGPGEGLVEFPLFRQLRLTGIISSRITATGCIVGPKNSYNASANIE